MGYLITLWVIYLIVIILILFFPPDGGTSREIFDAKIREIWCAVNICRTSGYGTPLIRIQSPKGANLLKINFPDRDRVIVSLPLIQIEQTEAKQAYLDIFANHGLEVNEAVYADKYPVLNATLDRNDEGLGPFIAKLYQQFFKARINDKINLSIWTIGSDLRVLKTLFSDYVKANPDAKFLAPSSKYNGRSVFRVQAERIITASSIFLFPLIIILSYESFGTVGLCWGALGYYGFFFIYRTFYHRHPVLSAPVWENFLYCILFARALITQNTEFVQSILSIIVALGIIVNGLCFLNISKPKLKNEIQLKADNPKNFRRQILTQIFAGVLILGANEWARRNLNLDQWVWFYGLVRFELLLASLIIILPILFIFLKIQNKSAEQTP